jgi:hypothetical protein
MKTRVVRYFNCDRNTFSYRVEIHKDSAGTKVWVIHREDMTQSDAHTYAAAIADGRDREVIEEYGSDD